MFQKQDMSNREVGREPETIISASVKLEGDFVSQGNVLIEGEVEGSLKTEKDLRVGEHARIAADVSAASASVAGEVRGNLEVTNRLELEPTARVYGDIKTSDLIVASGAIITGRITMTSGIEDASNKSSKGNKSVKPFKGVLKDEDVKELLAEETKEVMGEMEEKETAKKTINAFFTK